MTDTQEITASEAFRKVREALRLTNIEMSHLKAQIKFREGGSVDRAWLAVGEALSALPALKPVDALSETCVERVQAILFPYLHDQITTEDAQKLIAELTPYLRTTEPVSVSDIYKAYVSQPARQPVSRIKAILGRSRSAACRLMISN